MLSPHRNHSRVHNEATFLKLIRKFSSTFKKKGKTEMSITYKVLRLKALEIGKQLNISHKKFKASIG